MTMKYLQGSAIMHDSVSRRDVLTLAAAALGGTATGCARAGVDLALTKEARMPQEKSFDTGTVKINYLAYGEPSGVAVVMLHGGAWCWQEYVSLIPPLGRERQIFALDGRGCGASSRVPDRYRLSDFADDASRFVRHLDRPVVLVGHSLGGVTALMTAEQCPEQVKGVIIEDAPLTLDNYRGIVTAGRDTYRLWLDLRHAARTEQELALSLAASYGSVPGVTSCWLLFFAGCLFRLDPTYFNAMSQDFSAFAAGYDCRRILSGLTCPVLFIRGERALGAVMTDGEVSLVRTRFGPHSCAEIPGIGHLLHLQEQGQAPVLLAMRNFLDEQIGSRT